MKKYLLFVYERYYPIGGMNDLRGSFDTIEEINLSDLKECEFYQIVNKETLEIIKTNDEL